VASLKSKIRRYYILTTLKYRNKIETYCKSLKILKPMAAFSCNRIIPVRVFQDYIIWQNYSYLSETLIFVPGIAFCIVTNAILNVQTEAFILDSASGTVVQNQNSHGWNFWKLLLIIKFYIDITASNKEFNI